MKRWKITREIGEIVVMTRDNHVIARFDICKINTVSERAMMDSITAMVMAHNWECFHAETETKGER